jgi:hypothetical protein
MTHTRNLALAAAGALALAGGGTALAAGGSHGHGTHNMTFAAKGAGHRDPLAAAAAYLGITTSQLQSDLESGKTLAQVADATSGKSAAGLVQALVAQETSELDAAVAAGKLTQAQEQTLLANLQQMVTDLVNGVKPAFGGPPGGFGFHGPGDDLNAAATYLGLTASALESDLQSGKTLAQIADATSGKSAAGLVQALVAHETTELDAAVAAGKLTQAQEQTLLANLQQLVTDRVNGTFPHDGPKGGFRPGGANA